MQEEKSPVAEELGMKWGGGVKSVEVSQPWVLC